MNIMLASCIALVSSLILTVIFIPLLIRFMRSHHEGQEIRDEGPKWHQKIWYANYGRNSFRYRCWYFRYLGCCMAT